MKWNDVYIESDLINLMHLLLFILFINMHALYDNHILVEVFVDDKLLTDY